MQGNEREQKKMRVAGLERGIGFSFAFDWLIG